MGDQVGAHGRGWLGLALGALAGVAVGALIVAGTIATGGALAIAVGALVAAGTVTGLASVGAKIGKRHLSGSSCGEVKGGASRTYIEGKAAARADEDGTSHNRQKIAQGSSTVHVEGAPLARVGDKVKCGGKLMRGCERTTIGGKATPAAEVDDGPSEGLIEGLELASLGCDIGAVLLTVGAAMAGGATLLAGAMAGAREALPFVAWDVGGRAVDWVVKRLGGEEAALWADALMTIAGGVDHARHGETVGESGGEPTAPGDAGADEPSGGADTHPAEPEGGPEEAPAHDGAPTPEEAPTPDDAPVHDDEAPPTDRDGALPAHEEAAAKVATAGSASAEGAGAAEEAGEAQEAAVSPACASCDAKPPAPADPAEAARAAIEDGTVWDRPAPLEGVSPEETELAARPGRSADQVRARKKVARRFYKEAGMTADEARSHMRGIDFEQPVTTGPPPPAPAVQVQHQIPGGRQGQYFADHGTTPSELGIHHQGATMGPDGWGTGPVVDKVPAAYKVDPSTPYLESTSAPLTDTWSVPGGSYGTSGGGTQRFIPRSAHAGVTPTGDGAGGG
jgi:uncharacterized Zn-binding protein involved in type VI secretion